MAVAAATTSCTASAGLSDLLAIMIMGISWNMSAIFFANSASNRSAVTHQRQWIFSA